jgi:hypothetical protein
MRYVYVLALMFGMTAPAIAQPTEQAAASEKKPKPKMICEEEEQIGTRLGKRKVCHPAGSDRQFRTETRDSVDAIQRNLGLQH